MEADDGAGLEAARRALTITGEARLTTAPLVVEVNTRHNQAIDPDTPTGLAAALGELLPGTTRVGRLPSELGDQPVVLVIHDAARHPWVRETVAEAVRRRPDVIVVETGIPAEPAGAAYIATNGISKVSAKAAAQWLTR
ncbi:hypothetical protein GCM10020219_036900 [Nonomuraea dietziae]